MKRECKFCKKEIAGKNWRTYTAHLLNCKENPNYIKRYKKLRLHYDNKIIKNRKEYKFKCLKCNKDYFLNLTENQYKKEAYKKHCSRKCANSRIQTEEIKKKRSISAKNFLETEKGKQQLESQRLRIGKLNPLYNENSNKRINNKIKIKIFKKYKGICQICNKKLDINGNIYNKKIEWITHHNKLNLLDEEYFKTEDRILLCNSCHMGVHNRIRSKNRRT